MRVASAFRIQDNAFAISLWGAALLVLLQLAVTMVAYTGATITLSAFLDEAWIDAIADTGLTALIIAFFTVLTTELHSPPYLAKLNPKALTLLLVIALPAKLYAMLAVAGVEWVIEGLPFLPSSLLDYEGPESTLGTWYSYCVLAPVSEEIFYRGLIGAGLIRWYGEKRGLIFSTLIFGLVHLQPGSFANAAVLGVVLQWLYLRTQNLGYPILFHAVVNAFALLVSTDTGDEWLSGLPDLLVYLCGALLFVAGIFFIRDRNALAGYFNQKPASPASYGPQDRPAPGQPAPVDGA